MIRSIQLVACAFFVVAATSRVAGQPPQSAESERLLREAEVKAKAGQYAAAIELYKRSDELQPRAAISCFIGLAYVRTAAWAQAELAFDACRRRVSDGDPAPAWLAKAQRELETKIEVARVPTVVFRVHASDPEVPLSISGWPAGESFAPRQLHLPAGHYRVDAVGADGRSVRTEFDVTDSTVTVEIDLNQSPKRSVAGNASATPPSGAEAASSPVVTHDPAPPSGRKKRSRVVGYALLGGGSLAVAVGAAAHVLAARDRTAMEASAAAWDAHRAAFERERVDAIGGYAVGAALLSVGTYLVFRSSGSERAVTVAPMVSAASDHPLGLALEWSQ